MSLPGLIPKTTLPYISGDFLDRISKNTIKLPDVAPIIPPREIMVLNNGKTDTTGKLPGIGYVDKLPSTNVPTYPIKAEVIEGQPTDNLLYILLGITLLGYLAT